MKSGYSVGLFCFLILAVSCNNLNESNKNRYKSKNDSTFQVLQNSSNDPAFENYVVDTIFSLKEVQEKSKYLDSLTNHSKGVTVIVNRSDENGGVYEIRVGYNGEERFETYYNFYFDSVSKQISIMDVVSGDKISLDNFRKDKL
jgi:hypothetical protein